MMGFNSSQRCLAASRTPRVFRSKSQGLSLVVDAECRSFSWLAVFWATKRKVRGEAAGDKAVE